LKTSLYQLRKPRTEEVYSCSPTKKITAANGNRKRSHAATRIDNKHSVGEKRLKITRSSYLIDI
jgi:hypothetical protein